MATLAARITALAGAIRDKLNTMMPRLVPGGGTTGQALVKTSNADHAVGWASAGGGWTDISVVTPGAVNAVDFDPIPQIYSDLRLVYEGISHNSGSNQQLTLSVKDASTFATAANVTGTNASSAVLYGSSELIGYRANSGTVTSSTGNMASSPTIVSGGSLTVPWRVTSGIRGLRVAITGGATFDAGTLRLQARA